MRFLTRSSIALPVLLLAFATIATAPGEAVADTTAPGPAPAVGPDDWAPLVASGDLAAARHVCGSWLEATAAVTKAEGHKCLANVELSASDAAASPSDAGRKAGGYLLNGVTDEAVARALEHLDAAVRLAPQDLTIHQGRLYLLVQSTRVDALIPALEESARLYAGADAMEVWLTYSAELFERHQYGASIALMRVLDARFPDDHRVAANLSASYAMLGQDAEALAWARKAVSLAPDNPIDNWNLARIYDYTGELEIADAAYRRSLSKQTAAQRAESACIYAQFVEKKRKDLKRACALQRENGCQPTACTAR